MKVRKRAGVGLALIAAIAMLGIVAAGCGGGSSTTDASTDASSENSAAPSGEGQELTIGYSNPLASEEGLRSVGYGEKQAIKELGLNWNVKETDAKLSPEKQVSDLESFVTQNVAGITSWTLEEGAAEGAYREAKSAGIPIIGLNSNSPSFTSTIAGDTDMSCHVADQQAEYIAKLVPNAEVVMIGGPPVPSITLTTNCFSKAAKANGLKVIESQNDMDSNAEGGQKVASAMLLKHPDVQAMWVFAETTALGASAAAKAAGKEIWSGEDGSGLVLITRNGTAPGAAAIKSGDLTATWDNNQPLLGAAAIQLLKYHLVDGVPLSDLPKKVRIKSKLWDQSNIDSYEPALSREVPLPLPEEFEKP